MFLPCSIRGSSFLLLTSGLALASCLALGCGSTETKNLGGPATPGKSPIESKPQNANDKSPDLRTVDVDGYNTEITAHRGKVVLVDFWATWCGPCTKQFPHTVELHEKYSGQGLDIISMSLDDEGEEAAVREFLKEQKAHFVNLRSEYGAGVESSNKFDLKAAVPHYRLYDKTGKLRESWDGKPEGVEGKIEELLKE